MERNALITGASRGLGQALAQALSESGWTLTIDGRDPSDLASAAGGLGPGRITAVTGDVTDPTHRDDLIEAVQAMGGIDLLVNNASSLGPSPQPNIADYPIGALREVYEVNVFAAVALIQRALPLLRARGGTVLNITSDAAVEQYEGWGGYGSSKAALEQLSSVLAAEEPGIRVYWFDPGDMQTRMHQEAFPGEDISDRPLPVTRVPALMRLLDERPSSGRYTAEQLLTRVSA